MVLCLEAARLGILGNNRKQLQTAPFLERWMVGGPSQTLNNLVDYRFDLLSVK
jgi:hypothetical protein